MRWDGVNVNVAKAINMFSSSWWAALRGQTLILAFGHIKHKKTLPLRTVAMRTADWAKKWPRYILALVLIRLTQHEGTTRK